MARQAYQTNPWEKKLEVFQDFSAGMNTVTAQDNMKNNELSDARNMIVAERGSLMPRTGSTRYHTALKSGKGQGHFRYYRDGVAQDIFAYGGRFYVNGEERVVLDMEGGVFQSQLPIQGVQFGKDMYFATGTKLTKYDGTDFRVVAPYRPQPLEALYIGLNGLADDPTNFMQDGTSASPRIDGVTFEKRYGVTNQPIRMNIFVSKPAALTMEYQIERRMSTDPIDKWVVQASWSTTIKSYTFITPNQGDMEIRVKARDKADPTYEVEEMDENDKVIKKKYDKIIAEYYVPKYKIKAAPDPEDLEPDVSLVHSCRNIMLHWNRLIMFGEERNPDMIYVSHLNRGDYFPIPNTLRFENPKNEKLNCLVPFRGMLLAFTDNCIQALYGNSPQDFQRVTLNTGIGCIAPNTVAIMKNYATFLSNDGVHILKTVGYTDDKANVEKIDHMVSNMMHKDKDASALFHNGEYHLFFPARGERFRYNLDLQAWMMDESVRFGFHNVYEHDQSLYGQMKASGNVLKFDSSVMTDDGQPYEVSVETRFFSFDQPYHSKKLKELQMMFVPMAEETDFEVTIFADEEATLSPDSSFATVQNNTVVWNTVQEPSLAADIPNLTLSGYGELIYERKTLRLTGRCLKTKIRLVHKESKPFKLIGFAYIFKLKKP